jgi:hypothetical protein
LEFILIKTIEIIERKFKAIFLEKQFAKLDLLFWGGILFFALVVRLFNARMGLPYMHHWDEPEIAFNALDMLRDGNLNPDFFNYGSLLIYLNLGVDWLHALCLRALPAVSPFSLGSLENLRYGANYGFDWYISHPTFLFWNRVLTALFGTATVALVYYLGLKLGNRLAAIAGAVLLAGTLFHIQHSAYVTTDVPMTFLVWSVLLFVYLYLDRRENRYFIMALIAAGLATSTKYNAGLVVIAPAAALFLGRKFESYRPWLWALIPLVPALAFFVGTPYALFDFPTFYEDVRYEILHYSVEGHGGANIEPGLPHMLHQLKLIGTNFGWVFMPFAALGLIKLIRHTPGLLFLGYQAIYFLSVTQTKVSFHRNALILYPFIAILFGLGLWFVYSFLAQEGRLRKYLAVALILLVSGILGFSSTKAAYRSWKVWSQPETRTRAVMRINEITESSPDALVGIALELRMHPRDLARLDADYRQRPYLKLIQQADDYDILLGYGNLQGSNPEQRDRADKINAVIEQIPEKYEHSIGSGPLYLQIYSTNPEVVIIEETDTLADEIDF